jgi:predicted aldo/keto reductase-like oxidoreductase
MIQALEKYPFDDIMAVFNYFDRFNFPLNEEKLLPLAQERNVGIVGMKAVADGLLWRSAEVAFRYAWSLPIHTMVAGMNTLSMFEQDFALAEKFTPISDPEKEQLFSEAPELGNYVCRQCNKCLPCPENINIPEIFKFEGWYDRQIWDGIVRDPSDYALRQRLRFWFQNEERARAAYESRTPKADACTECGDCEPRCPYKLPIISKLRNAHYKMIAEPRF